MGNISAAGKLELVKQVRESYNRNRYDMADRERVLYGRSSRYSYDGERGSAYEDNGLSWDAESGESDKKTVLVSRGLFCIRLIAAITVFILFVAMDLKEINVSGICAEDVYNAISQDYTVELDNWIAQMTP
jgi:hypothetical protein